MDSADAGVFLTARWSHLAMANYEVAPSLLQGLVPRGTQLDLWGGRCFVSVVGFQFLDTRVLGVPVPFHRNFEEVNLRFYVKRVVEPAPDGQHRHDELRRGVVFVKELVPRRAIAWVANALYNEKYVALPMSHENRLAEATRSLCYCFEHAGKACELSMVAEGEAFVPEPTSEEAFITEHYWGYTGQRDGSTLEYRVEHPRWRVWQAASAELRCDTAALYGADFAPFLSRPPSSCFIADGSAILVRRGVAI